MRPSAEEVAHREARRGHVFPRLRYFSVSRRPWCEFCLSPCPTRAASPAPPVHVSVSCWYEQHVCVCM